METKKANLALQGGGAHGAFTWGVLDRLLEEPSFAIDGVSATSAGAMNAAVLAHGLTVGGRDGAKEALADFWHRVSDAWKKAFVPPLWQSAPLPHSFLKYTPGFVFFDMMSRMFSPYQFNPLNLNPLKSVLETTIDFERLRKESPIKLFLSATNVRTGKVRVFETGEVSATGVMASACLPQLYQAVEIDGEHYWDGGYMGNPALYPLIYNCSSRDIIVIHVNPTERVDVPTSAQEILGRINEISFNSSLFREMRAIAFVTKLIDDLGANAHNLKRMLIHSIDADEVMQGLDAASKMNADWGFLTHLHKIGRERAEAWLKSNLDNLGVQSTVDIRAKYL
ncbi:MAG TPA: patatin-like phospholipase family protein [Xanthobacteraceae bacterium]|jgi:NTE family protein|nr:patatin-like phospholipase family protein [Xanthobacteraceae bacterium]